MDFRTFSELPLGTWFFHKEELHIKSSVGLPNAVLLAGPHRGTGAAILPTQFVSVLTPRDMRVLETAMTRIQGAQSPKFHPDFEPLADGSPYFIGADDYAYAFDALAIELLRSRPDLRGEPLFTQLDALGLAETLRRGRTPHTLPATLV